MGLVYAFFVIPLILPAPVVAKVVIDHARRTGAKRWYTGHIVWMARGAVTVGLGDNRGRGGSNASTFSLPVPVAGATLTLDGKAIIENGVLK